MPRKKLENIFLVIDANVLLHFPPPDKIKWQNFLDFKALTLLICPQLLREISDKKDTALRKAIRDRAAKREKWIDDIIESKTPKKIRESVFVDVITHDPIIDFGKENLTKDRPDDWYIASAIQFQSNKKKKVGIVSRDLGVKLKVKHTQIFYIRIPENFELPTGLTEEEKEAQQLKQELEQYKNIKPKLEFGFVGKIKTRTIFEVILPELLPKNSYVSNALKEEQKKLKELESKEPIESQFHGIQKRFFENQLTEQINYLRELTEFFEKEWEFQKIYTKIVKVKFSLSNLGTCPSTNPQIWFSIPDEIQIFDEDKLKKWVKENYPDKPKKSGLYSFGTFTSSALDLVTPRMNYDGFPHIKGPSVSFNLDELQHHSEYTMDPLYLDFSNYSSNKSFAIQPNILCDEMPEPEEIRLVVKIKTN